MKNQSFTINFVVTLSNNSMPFADDARYDVKEQTYLKETFDTEQLAKKYFNSKVKELDLYKTGRGNSQYGNGQYELYMFATRVY